MNERTASRLIQAGAGLLVLAIVTGALIAFAQVPRLALSVHITMLLTGIMLIAFGLIWPRLALSPGQEKVAFWALVGGALGNWTVGMTAAYAGIGARTLPLAAGPAMGMPLTEKLFALAALTVVISTSTGLGLVLWGVRRMVARAEVVRRPWWTWQRGLATVGGVMVVALLGVHGFLRSKLPPVLLPKHEDVQVTWLLEQNWTQDDWQWFYHTSQGGSLELPIPYEWLIHLEQPTVPLFVLTRVGRFMDPAYISRFGFLPDPVRAYDAAGTTFSWARIPGSMLEYDEENNPDALPVGFVRTPAFLDRGSGHEADMVGFTCAACHTGQLNYRGRGIRIEGGPAMTDLGKFRIAMGQAVGLTYLLPARFARFADAVLGEDRTAAETAELRAWMGSIAERGGALKDMLQEKGTYPTDEGFGRLDAIGRIGNYVFGTGISQENYAVSDAPVSFPPIWDTPWFEWVQYNASFKQPMMRNAGEAMGLFAFADFKSLTKADSLFSSTMNVVNLHEMESLIRGRRPYEGLRSPPWPSDILGAIDPARAGRGAALYENRCQGCHLPPLTDARFFADSLWTKADNAVRANRYLKLKLLNIYDIGTDPKAAVNFYQRTVQMGELGEMFQDTLGMGGTTTAGLALPFLIRKTAQKRYEDLGLPDSIQDRMDGYRTDEIQAKLVYKARPLNGMWATPPFLHNNSVPSVYQLLGPQDQRDDVFHLGTKEYDPIHLGYVKEDVVGGFLMDTSKPGNSNTGHEFKGKPTAADPTCWKTGGPGVIGCALTEAERLDVIEYLKTLPGAPSGAQPARVTARLP